MKALPVLAAAVLLASVAAPALAAGCADPSAEFNLSGTTWTGYVRWDDGETHTLKLKLRADCVAEYSYDGNTYTNGRWVQRGSLIEWDTNDHYAVYLGEASAASIGGVIYNRAHDHGSWVFMPGGR
ncbi:hypothetical protein QO010_002831 [Caulobacter ginsengisoli]|uniref:DUF2147 domain-containing protein n=1 Tax=Caulobacter ginsengisoli TaxID=400775 RepID=A0ABU0IVU7_9CAUL|nr:hypothetical protein [Caulobacter ginsengisoli]MDQ0465047.1 hypothetical protein [Caulobacter ginsengisoli]